MQTSRRPSAPSVIPFADAVTGQTVVSRSGSSGKRAPSSSSRRMATSGREVVK
jgi:hypothetical protein